VKMARDIRRVKPPSVIGDGTSSRMKDEGGRMT